MLTREGRLFGILWFRGWEEAFRAWALFESLVQLDDL